MLDPRWAWAGAALLVLAACRTTVNLHLSSELAHWVTGPAQWLLLPDEVRQFGGLRSDAEARRFIEEFWARRDTLPEAVENPFRERFESRVGVADRLYAEGFRRGSLSDRGGVFILLGSPAELRQGRRMAPSPTPHGRRTGRSPTRTVVFEVWTYRPDQLQPALLEMVGPEAAQHGVSLTFEILGERAVLIEGRSVLKAAARAAVRAPAAPTPL